MLKAYIVGQEKVIARLGSLPELIANEVEREIRRLTFKLEEHVKSDKLSGFPLHRRTGTLRASINSRVTRNGSRITGSVGTNVVYAAVHEYGFDGMVDVRQYTRHVTQVFGRATSAIQLVRAHVRHMHMPERSFLRSSLAEMTDEIRKSLLRAVRKATRR